MSNKFVMFGPSHLVTLMLVALMSGVAFVSGQSRWARAISGAGAALMTTLAVLLWLPRLRDGFDAATDLPLALCDIAFLLCLVCFIKPRDIMLTLVAYWGLAGTLQAIITPDVIEDFPSREFWLFFVGHAIIVIAVFFLIGKSRPPHLASARGVGHAFLGLLVYTAVVGGLDAAFGWNYGYLRARPAGASVLDKMGEWPLYIFGGLALALVLFCLVAGLLRVLWNLSPSGDQER